MQAILQNIGVISLIVSLINICITVYNWYCRRPRLEFYEHDRENFFLRYRELEMPYKESTCSAFIYVKIANLSETPCTISQFELNVNGYEGTFFRSSTSVCAEYVIEPDGHKYHLHKEEFIQLPCTIPPLGYVEGMLLFPYAPQYKEDSIKFEITAKTPRKEFSCYGNANYMKHNQLHHIRKKPSLIDCPCSHT